MTSNKLIFSALLLFLFIGCRLMPDEMARKIEEGDIFVFDHEIDSLRDMVESPSKTARYHEVQRGLVLVDFNCCEQKVGQPVYGYIARWREDMDRLLYLAADSTMPYDEVMCMVEAYRARVKAETHPWAKGFLAFGMDEVSQEVKRRVSKRCGRDFIPVDFLGSSGISVGEKLPHKFV